MKNVKKIKTRADLEMFCINEVKTFYAMMFKPNQLGSAVCRLNLSMAKVGAHVWGTDLYKPFLKFCKALK